MSLGRTARACIRTSYLSHKSTKFSILRRSSFHKPKSASSAVNVPRRTYTSKSNADSILEELQEQYATAKDEFEIASEETDKKTVYAADDREAAKEELQKLKTMFKTATEKADAETEDQVRKRVGPRIRELERAVEDMELRAMED